MTTLKQQKNEGIHSPLEQYKDALKQLSILNVEIGESMKRRCEIEKTRAQLLKKSPIDKILDKKFMQHAYYDKVRVEALNKFSESDVYAAINFSSLLPTCPKASSLSASTSSCVIKKPYKPCTQLLDKEKMKIKKNNDTKEVDDEELMNIELNNL